MEPAWHSCFGHCGGEHIWKSRWRSCGSDTQGKARWPLEMWFWTCYFGHVPVYYWKPEFSELQPRPGQLWYPFRMWTLLVFCLTVLSSLCCACQTSYISSLAWTEEVWEPHWEMNQIARGIARGHCCLPLDFCENLIWLMRPHGGGLTVGEE